MFDRIPDLMGRMKREADIQEERGDFPAAYVIKDALNMLIALTTSPALPKGWMFDPEMNSGKQIFTRVPVGNTHTPTPPPY